MALRVLPDSLRGLLAGLCVKVSGSLQPKAVNNGLECDLQD